MAEKQMTTIPKRMWWTKGECVVEIVSAGHFPTTVMVKLPNDITTEVEIVELGDKNGGNS